MAANVTLRVVVPEVAMALDPLDDFPDFMAQARARLAQGRIEYGDKSFDADPLVLVNELQQEALDLCDWGFILWRRLEAMKRAMLKADTIPSPPPPAA